MQEYSQGVPAFFISHGFILLLAGNTKHNLFRVFCLIRGFFWGLLRKKYNHHSGRQQIKSLTKNLD